MRVDDVNDGARVNRVSLSDFDSLKSRLVWLEEHWKLISSGKEIELSSSIEALEDRMEQTRKVLDALDDKVSSFDRRITELEEEPFADRSIQPIQHVDRVLKNVKSVAVVTVCAALTVGIFQPRSSEGMVRIAWLGSIVAVFAVVAKGER